jgi:phosphate:Na+ symporter
LIGYLSNLPFQALAEILGGGSLFVYGIKLMSEGLQKFAGNRFRAILEKVLSSRISAALLGTCLASLLQSSSSASILVVGFLNAGLISLYQALAIFLGTALGATVAVQFIAFQPAGFALLVIFLGVLLKFFFKRSYLVNSGELLLGAGLLFLGLRILESGLSPISQSAILQGINAYVFAWHISAVFFGVLITLLVQSPAAATGIVIALCGSGLITFNESIGMVLGCNLGTAFIALIAAISGTVTSRKAAFVNLMINFTAVLFGILLIPLLIKSVIYFSPLKNQFPAEIITGAEFAPPRTYLPRMIANAHTIFSLFMVCIFLPLIGFLARAVKLSGKSDAFSSHTEFLDARVLNTPTIAILQAKNEIVRMSAMASTMYDDLEHLLYRSDARGIRRIMAAEDALDTLHRQISNFLVLLSRKDVDPENSIRIPLLLQLSHEIEQFGDLNVKFLADFQKKKSEKIHFSLHAMTDLKRLAAAVGDIAGMLASLMESQQDGLQGIDDYRSTIEEIRETALEGHVKRMKTGHCTVESGLLYNDMVTTMVSISECASNIVRIGSSIQ